MCDTVFEVIVMPGATGVLSESADVAVAVAVVTLPSIHWRRLRLKGLKLIEPLGGTVSEMKPRLPPCKRTTQLLPGLRPVPVPAKQIPSVGWIAQSVSSRLPLG